MHFANTALLLVTFIASATLLVVMQRRRLMGRLPLFVALILLYIVRTFVLLVGMKSLNRAAYLQISSLMSLFDLALQLALAYSLLRHFTQSRLDNRHFSGRRLQDSALFLFAIGLLLAGCLTMLLISALPGYSPVPLDRGAVLSGLVFLFLLAVQRRSEDTAEARLLVGFCVISAANILSQCGKTLAAFQHDPRLFLAWAYGNTAVWVGVLVFWILRLRDPSAGRDVPGGRAVMAR